MIRPTERCPSLRPRLVLSLNLGLALITAMCGLACAPVPPVDTDCELGEWTSGLQAVDRKLLGLAAEYPADTAVRANEQLLASSQRTRRELAWRDLLALALKRWMKVLSSLTLSAFFLFAARRCSSASLLDSNQKV